MTFQHPTTIQDRILACLPYLLVLIYGVPFGDSLMAWVPGVIQVAFFTLLAPLMFVYNAIPMAGLIIFGALFVLVVSNERIPHFIRFNTIQAMLLCLVLFLCDIGFKILLGIPDSGFLLTVLANAIFLGALAAFGYAVVQSGLGRYAEIPTISEAAYLQVR